MIVKILFVTTCIGLSQSVTYPALTRQQYAEIVAQQQTVPEHQPQTISIIPKRHYKPTPQALVDEEPVPSPAQYKQVLEQPVYYQQQPQQYPQPAPQPQYVPQPQYQSPPPKAPKYKAPAGAGYKLESQQEPAQAPEEYDPNPQYQFGFDIHDDENTNYHNRKEQRDGDKITGSYSVVDSDGFIRTVTYTADPKEGFKAEVSREPTDIRVKIPTPAPQPAPQQYKLAPAPSQYKKPSPQVQYVEREQEEAPRAQYVASPSYPAPSQYRLVQQPSSKSQSPSPLFQAVQYEQ
uniref:Larval cuticle protein A1A n=1 Tax=Cacopsylla melanoneura TaxID=428564 RepID=A0A8D9F426_9HEMI